MYLGPRGPSNQSPRFLDPKTRPLMAVGVRNLKCEVLRPSSFPLHEMATQYIWVGVTYVLFELPNFVVLQPSSPKNVEKMWYEPTGTVRYRIQSMQLPTSSLNHALTASNLMLHGNLGASDIFPCAPHVAEHEQHKISWLLRLSRTASNRELSRHTFI